MPTQYTHLLRHCIIATLIGWLCVGVSSWLMLPDVCVALAMCTVWVMALSSLMCCRWRSVAAIWILTVAMCLLAVGACANMHLFTTGSGGTLAHPVLENPDSAATWNNALAFNHLPTDGFPHTSQRGYGFFVALLIAIFGRSVAVPIVFNMLCTLLTIVVCGSIAVKVLRTLLPERSVRWIAAVAMVMLVSLCYFLQMGDLVLKEAPSVLASAAAIRAIIGIYRPEDADGRYNKLRMTILFVAGTLTLTVIRNNYLLFIALGVVMLLPWERITRRRDLTPIVKAVVMGVFIYLIHQYIGNVIQHKKVLEIASSDEPYLFMFLTPNQEPWASIIGDYGALPWWRKILMLPLCAAVQYVIPFPWHFTQHIAYGYTQVYAHISYTWYAFGGLCIYFGGYAISHLRKLASNPAGLLLLQLFAFGVIYWLIPGYINAGLVSRYAMCAYPALLPGAVYVVAKCLHRRSFGIYAVCYILLMCIGLLTCYFLHSSATATT